MAKTLVGLYDSRTDAEHVVQDLVGQGFSHSDVRLVSNGTAHHGGEDASSASWGTEQADTGLISSLTDVGVPHDEARLYQEGVRRGGALVVVESADDEADRGMEILNRLHPVDIRNRSTQWQSEGWTHTSTSSMAAPPITAATPVSRERTVADDEAVAIPVVEEEVVVGKREVERGRVRVQTHVEEQPVEQDIRLREEKVTVERRPVDRPASSADLEDIKEETIEFTETAEEAVVSKRVRVVEEVIVRKDVDEHVETVRDTVRRTDVDIDRAADVGTETIRDAPSRTAATGSATGGFEAHMADFRRHHTSTFPSGGDYSEYEPAYRYGYELYGNERYRNRDWAAFEADARRDWETRHPGTWERFKDAIRYGWNSMKTRP